MKSQFSEESLDRIRRCGVIAVVVVDEPADVVPLSKALLACKIDVIELTLRTPKAIDALRRVKDEVPEMLAGVGTILTADQVREVSQAGAAFGVAPGLNANVVQAAQDCGLPFAPGVVTPSEIESAVQLGCRELKFFPAEASGGIDYLRSVAAPYAHLGLQYIPLGGIKAHCLAEYLHDPAVLAVGGSWIAPRKQIQDKDWSLVIDRATEAKRIVLETPHREKKTK
ncbi:bifunctional 4-hydroxy-2-oxoglutarate aldolase/2-dehydro-3-deoxy-phosphogluconate aldolase [Stieleria varia]|uniref:Putative KHG/KDPG aldolase n=1 Tax=Stieleria varia TaxID=2528005 RepID=A0A5C6B9B9_9BACT|nr:bifunctional 4-hydroxy-2-oxoglutarate aldolase/2-dehydro-3-deoxy-phosphogluconate aldolase [Stieleria varia]TWU08031.1 putative KHG/KDPG aldolase [Stieleria varia]